MTRIRAVAVVLAAMAVGGAMAQTAAAQLAPARCAQAGPLDTSRCGTVTVPLDRSGATPGTIRLRVRVDAPSTSAATGTVLVLAGGPGQAAAPLIGPLSALLGSSLTHRRLVAFDQRGTGASGALSCPTAEKRSRSTAQFVAACAAEIGPKRADYTTAASVEDVEAVRAALGVDKLILFGTSYGTKVAVAYAAAHPEHVERLVLDSTLGPDGVDPLGTSTAQAVVPMLTDLCRDGGCPFAPDAAALLNGAVARAAAKPVAARVVLPTGRSVQARVDPSVVLSNLLAGDLAPLVRAGLPAALDSLAHGDAAPLLTLGGFSPASSASTGDGVSDALYLATTCEDQAAWSAGTAVVDRPAALSALMATQPATAWGPFAPDVVVKTAGIAQLCATWPDSPIAQPAYVAPTAPTLILSGAQDVRTPPAAAAALAATTPAAQVLTVPDTGHSVLGSATGRCARSRLATFLDGGTVAPCPAAARSILPIAAVAPRSLAAIPAPHGLPTRVGRTWVALQLTFADLGPRLSWGSDVHGNLAVGGLRGGRVVTFLDGRRTSRVEFQRYAYVPGVTIGGHTTLNTKTLDLRIGGSAAAHGTAHVDLRRGRLTAVIAGHRLRARLDGSAISAGL